VSDPFDPELNDSFLDPINGSHDATPHLPWWVQWRPAIIVGAVLSAVASVVFLANQTPGAPVVVDTTTTVPTQCTEASPVTCFSLTRVIRNGTKGDDVRRLQTRLKELKFDPGKIDGVYGGDTRMAVWAFQGIVLQLKGKEKVDFVTPALWDVMRGDVQIAPRRQPGSPNHAEVYLPEQVLTIFKGPELVLVTHISSGTGETWCEPVTIDPGEEGNENGKEPIYEGWCGNAITPGGLYYFYNRKVGLRESKLGTMWNPVYFNFGIAVHGAMNVPNEPASHGCIRIPIFISEYFQSLVKYNDRIYVFDGVKEPEDYGSQPPAWDKKDPNFTTTTSTPTSTTTPPTTAPRRATTTSTVTSTTTP
jgi:peptidoglycan hydrolase-like protein with peptidoglycan-binding domain